MSLVRWKPLSLYSIPTYTFITKFMNKVHKREGASDVQCVPSHSSSAGFHIYSSADVFLYQNMIMTLIVDWYTYNNES